MILCLFSWNILCDANLDCQLKGIFNTHENKSLSRFMREFLDLLNWNGKTHPITSSTTPWTGFLEEQKGERELRNK